MPAPSIDASRHVELSSAWERTYAAGRKAPGHPPDLALGKATTRGAADALAAWRRWHAPNQQQRFSANQRPWFDMLERARVETLASAELPGMASNLATLMTGADAKSVSERLYRVARQVFAGQNPTEPVLIPLAVPYETAWPMRLIRTWNKRKHKGTERHLDFVLTESCLLQALQEAARHLDDSQAFTDGLAELIARLAELHRAETPANPASEATDSETGGEQEHPDSEHFANTSLAEELAERDDMRQGYAVFSRQWDEEFPASRWATPQDTIALRGLDRLDRRRVRQLAHRLQRRLMAARQRHWLFDQEEGRLDSRQLARLVGDTPTRRVFRIEQTSPLPDACVTLLVDQSGSMSGRRRHMAALAIDLAVHTLETCQIRCEVLGFTTRFAADNPLEAQWRRNRMDHLPGRLNAIRHLIYKSAEQPWRRQRPQLGYLLRDLPGHENIDGEAIDWAAQRLSRRPEPHKILIVLSDGAPYDKATAQANGRDFLERHLRHIIAEVESSPIHLTAIGTGQDVARFYQHVLTVRQPEEVAETLFEQLGDLLIPGQTARRAS